MLSFKIVGEAGGRWSRVERIVVGAGERESSSRRSGIQQERAKDDVGPERESHTWRSEQGYAQ